jgi:hypothetical protein
MAGRFHREAPTKRRYRNRDGLRILHFDPDGIPPGMIAVSTAARDEPRKLCRRPFKVLDRDPVLEWAEYIEMALHPLDRVQLGVIQALDDEKTLV